ncbi:MAG: holo-[acyl-carrier-protein] synthase [Actinobacteria bacterium]|jgi:holo-[acyl-carrier protein] synthase|nr:MAG: holo-[acyl-carrier-protein] synthase [Actinomycetota bacterium]
MEILGVGIDLVEVARIERAITRHEGFVSRVFSLRERARCEDCARPGRRYAACFAAKEAAGKALGTGIRGLDWRELEMLAGDGGRPYMELSGRAGEAAAKRGVVEILVSVSHTGDLAIAIAQAVGGGVTT